MTHRDPSWGPVSIPLSRHMRWMKKETRVRRFRTTGGLGLCEGSRARFWECALQGKCCNPRWRETLPPLSPGHTGKHCAQQSAHFCHLFLVTLGKSLPNSKLVFISVEERYLTWEGKEVQWENVWNSSAQNGCLENGCVLSSRHQV